MQLGNFFYVFLARHFSGTYAHHQEHYMLSCSIWFSAPSFWMGGGLDSPCVGRVCGAYGAVAGNEYCVSVNARRIYTQVHNCTDKIANLTNRMDRSPSGEVPTK